VEESAPEDFGVYRSNWAAINLFIRIQTQWVSGATGKRTGLNYTGVRFVAKWGGIKFTPELFAQIQLMELTTIKDF
jgi:hypothetical protein